MKRTIFASAEASYQAKHSPNKMVKVYSMFPVDRADCPCAPLIRDFKKKLAMSNQRDRQTMIEQQPFIECPRDKSKMTRYEIRCSACKDLQGYIWARSATLEDWCDFHYVQWTKGDVWHGCFTPHISPITEELCFECCCGNDTRDFRANMTMNERQAMLQEARNRYGRKLGRPESKFFVRIAK